MPFLVFITRLFRAEWRAALDIQMDIDASARPATERVARHEGLYMRPQQRQIHRLLYDGWQRRELGGGMMTFTKNLANAFAANSGGMWNFDGAAFTALLVVPESKT